MSQHAPARDLPAAMADRLIVALDLPSVAEARRMTETLEGTASFYKIGLWLLFTEGCDRLIDDLIRQGKSIFLDYKMFDIGETVKQGVARATDRGIRFLTVHGDPEIMRAAVAGRGDNTHTKLFAITALTSLNDAALKQMGYGVGVDALIGLRVRSALECGCDGIIASAADDPADIRARFDAPGLLIATPGIRPGTAGVDDHKRPATPGQAIRRGADYLVVGRPIVQDPDPRAAALRIIAEMRAAL